MTWVHVPKEKLRKLDLKSVKCILIGDDEEAGSKVYQLYDPLCRPEITLQDVIIDESQLGIAKDTGHNEEMGISWEKEPVTASPASTGSDNDNYYKRLEPIEPQQDRQISIEDADIQDSIVVQPPHYTTNVQRRNQGDKGKGSQSTGGGVVCRSQRNGRQKELFAPQSHFALIANALEVEPQTLTKALTGVEKEKWQVVWEFELISLSKNNTWVFERLPLDRTAISC